MDTKSVVKESREMAILFGWEVPMNVGKSVLRAARSSALRTRRAASTVLKDVGVLPLDPADPADKLKISEAVIADTMPPRDPQDIELGYEAMWRKPAIDKDQAQHHPRTEGGRIHSYLQWYRQTWTENVPGANGIEIQAFVLQAGRSLRARLDDSNRSTTDSLAVTEAAGRRNSAQGNGQPIDPMPFDVSSSFHAAPDGGDK